MTIGKFITLRAMEGLLLLGPCFLLGATGCAVKNAIVLRHGVSTSGVVTNVRPTSDASEPFYRTTFTFKTVDGRSYSVSPELNERPAPYNIGDSIPVVYNRADPNDASISSMKEMWEFPIAFGAGGMVVFTIGLLLWKRTRSTYASDSNVYEQTRYERV